MNQEKTTNWKRNVNMKRGNRGSLDRISKFLSMILRHHPETIGIQLDEHGWANVEALIKGIQKTRPFDRYMLEEISL